MRAGSATVFNAALGALSESADRITLLRDGRWRRQAVDPQHVFTENLNQPFGMVLAGDYLYVGNTDALVRFATRPPVRAGATRNRAAIRVASRSR
ncbi:MAG: hypothetical protein IPL62_10940 [Caulobacteraceae bacterium]|nr:hypothetical protein [Caulobacteraceae bacterium]